MNHSLNSTFDSIVDSIFAKNDTSQSGIVTGGHAPACASSATINASIVSDPFRESMIAQRNNLSLLLRLIIKDLFKHRSKVLTPECRIYFDHLFVLLEKCLQHGLKLRKQMLSFKTDIWNVIELIGKKLPEANDTIESARHLPKIKTSLGRARAWFRLAMMNKKLSEYFQVLIDIRDSTLKEHYEGYAFMMTEDANVLTGLLVGLNSFDYYVYIKDEIFDYEPVIDLKYYIKENNQENGNYSDMDSGNGDGELNVDVLIEQNSYVEEINKHLKSTIKTLEEKLENLLERQSNNSSNEGQSSKSLMEFGTALVNKEKQIMEEERLRRELEKQLEMEVNLRSECETARNLLESDIQEKQDTIITLRSQLDEVKAINIQIFNKMQEKDKEIKEKNKVLSEFESKTSQYKKEIFQLEKKLAVQSENICDKELLVNYQKLIDEQQEQMTQMQLEIEDLKMKSSFNTHIKEAYNLLKKKFDENELALEEVGKQLQDSKLEIESLKEYNGHLKEAAWAKDSETTKCRQCDRDFTLARRKHHCRSCGEIFCNTCSNNEMPLASSKKPVRVCDACHAFLLERYSHTT